MACRAARGETPAREEQGYPCAPIAYKKRQGCLICYSESGGWQRDGRRYLELLDSERWAEGMASFGGNVDREVKEDLSKDNMTVEEQHDSRLTWLITILKQRCHIHKWLH